MSENASNLLISIGVVHRKDRTWKFPKVKQPKVLLFTAASMKLEWWAYKLLVNIPPILISKAKA